MGWLCFPWLMQRANVFSPLPGRGAVGPGDVVLFWDVLGEEGFDEGFGAAGGVDVVVPSGVLVARYSKLTVAAIGCRGFGPARFAVS